MLSLCFDMEKEIVLRVEKAGLTLGRKCLFDGFSLQVHRGEMVCITGESGCGKTSLLRAVLGFQPLSAGEIVVNGISLNESAVNELRRLVAYVPQELYLPCECVSEMVMLLFELKANKKTPFSYDTLMEWWNILGLDPELYRRKVNRISGGQRQRIILSVSAMLNKELYLVDEPTSALDPESVKRVQELFRRLTSQGAAVLAVSHDKGFMSVCDRVVNL